MQRVGVIGMGPIGNRHASIYQALPDVELVAVCDRLTDRADAAAARLGVPAFYSVADLLAGAELTMVSVATGGVEYGSDHYEPTMQALRAGLRTARGDRLFLPAAAFDDQGRALDDVTVATLVERTVGGGTVPKQVPIHHADTKSLRQIHDEIRAYPEQRHRAFRGFHPRLETQSGRFDAADTTHGAPLPFGHDLTARSALVLGPRN